MTSQKSAAQIQREVDDHLAEMRAIEREASAGDMTSTNLSTPIAYDRLRAERSSIPTHRWIGKCKRCGAAHRVDGRVLVGLVDARKTRHDVVRASDGRLLTTKDNGTNPFAIWVPCGDHHCLLRRVVEGTKQSKHVCGARCTMSTGPNCDCRCRGANHGSNL